MSVIFQGQMTFIELTNLLYKQDVYKEIVQCFQQTLDPFMKINHPEQINPNTTMIASIESLKGLSRLNQIKIQLPSSSSYLVAKLIFIINLIVKQWICNGKDPSNSSRLTLKELYGIFVIPVE